MFLEIEGDALINLNQVGRVEMRHHEKKALIWIDNAVVAESSLAYIYLKTHPELIKRVAL